MLGNDSPASLEHITAHRRRRIGLITVAVTAGLTALFAVQTALAGGTAQLPNYLGILAGQGAVGLAFFRWGITGPLYSLVAVLWGIAFVASLTVPGSHGSFVLMFFSTVPLFYMLGGVTRGRVVSGAFLALSLVLMVLRQNHLLAAPNVVAPQDHILAALACLVLQFVMAEVNEQEHRQRRQALLDHQFLEPNTGLPNRNALAQETLRPGQTLVLVKAANLAFEESWHAGNLAQSLSSLNLPGARPFWIAEDEVALVVTGHDPKVVEARILNHVSSRGPGVPGRSGTQVVSVAAPAGPVAGSDLLVEAELRALVGFPAWPASPAAGFGVHDQVLALRSCFAEGRLHAVFQPIYDVQSGGIAALEALTRLDLGSIVGPEPYLGLIESLGLDRQMTRFILAKAVEMGLQTDYSVSLNLTYRDLEDAAFLPTIVEACARFRHRKNKLILELTEHVAFSDPRLLNEFIARVHEVGGLVFLDDFGMGYSNYASIVAARFDAIKVAGAIVSRTPNSEQLRVLLSGIIQFAASSGVALVAEHISSRELYDLVTGEGVRYLQGFLLQEPIDGNRILENDFEFGTLSGHEFAAEVNSRSVPFTATPRATTRP